MDLFRNFSNLYEKDQNIYIDSEIFWNFATNIFEIFIKMIFEKLEKSSKLLQKLEVRKIRSNSD